MALTGVSESICLVCNSSLEFSTCINIFYTSLPRNGEMLASSVLSLLHPSVAELQSPCICQTCCDLFQMLEQAQSTVMNIQSEIRKIYSSKSRDKTQYRRTNEQNKLYVDNPTQNLSEVLNITSNLEQLSQIEVFGALDNDQSHLLTNADKENTNLPEISTKTVENHGTEFTVHESLQQKHNDIINVQAQPKSNESSDCLALEAPIQQTKCITVHPGPINNQKIDLRNEDCTYPNKIKTYIKTNNNSAQKTVGKLKNNPKPMKYSCDTCGKKWKTASELKVHIKSHSEIRPYMCEKCGQAYKHKNALEIHIGMHNGVNPFQCNHCNKCFTQKGALMRHLPIHTGEMPYQCELCGKRFLHHTSYNMHMLSHTGQKNHQCRICDVFLLSTSHLKRHMRVHTGEKSFICFTCGKRFAERYNLFVHQKIHNPTGVTTPRAKKSQYRCGQCSATFISQEKLDNHIEQQHNIEITTNEENILDNGENFWHTFTYTKLQSSHEAIKNVTDNYKNPEVHGTCAELSLELRRSEI